jgi:hypothetical protein
MTSSPAISGYHADFHEGDGTVGEWQGRRMACVKLALPSPQFVKCSVYAKPTVKVTHISNLQQHNV